ncbi:hypothetical protein SAMN05216581_4156 [Pseudomonas asplenii]|uniref:Uncharacterized protein n=1 Tax=Pseudomonas asplenii TaxID=53407 RepID=A0A1H6NUE1_9PSED|nr:hypothetical protein SAMN05216581_4156 [Pseudomonas fuscovaginae]
MTPMEQTKVCEPYLFDAWRNHLEYLHLDCCQALRFFEEETVA